MKQSNIMITGAAALVALVAVTGIALSSVLADDPTLETKPYHKFWGQDLSEEEKAEIIAKKEAWLADREAAKEELNSALEQGYDAWVEAITELKGEDTPILDTITADNFERFREAHEHMQAAHEIFEELGIEKGHYGKRGMKGMHGFKKMMGGHSDALSR